MIMTLLTKHQGETYNGKVFQLPVTWVSKCPEKGNLTLTYSRFVVDDSAHSVDFTHD